MNDLDVLPAVLPPEGVVITRLSDIAAQARQSRRVDIAGVRGCADALVVSALARDGGAPIVVVADDSDAALALAKDVKFLLGASPSADEDLSEGSDVLVLATAGTTWLRVKRCWARPLPLGGGDGGPSIP